MTDVKVVPKGKAYYENFNRIFNKKEDDEKEEHVYAEPQPAPRYDEVFEEGVELLNTL